MTKILAIGNSFSHDATYYLHDIAKHGGFETKVVNLYIGGCSLYTHWTNAYHEFPQYAYYLNGLDTGKTVSIKETLLEDDWDFITLQQASHDSGLVDTYYPYVIKLSAYVKEHAPKATQLIHQTWAYEIDSKHEAFVRYAYNQITMYQRLKAAYQQVSRDLGLEMIPCGDVIQALRGLEPFDYTHNGISLCRDGFHLHLVYGRYAAAATWFERLLKGNIVTNRFLPPDAKEEDKDLLSLIRTAIHRLE